MMQKIRSLVLAGLTLILLGLLIVSPITPTQAQQQNLLTNPGFEPAYNNGVANGWAAWYEDSGDKCNSKPSDWDFVCRPEWGEEGDWSNLGLVVSGRSQHVGAQYITWHAGVYQTVNVTPGTRVRFTVNGYSRAANEQPPAPSYTDWAPRMQVGIDPEGRGQWNVGVIWSGENNVRDSWQTLSIETTAGASGKVTVFVSSQFRLVVAVAHMDSWWDNAVLEAVAPAATPTATPAPTRAAPPTPSATSTPRPDGAIVHVVQSGDTLFGIALQYNITVDELRRLNANTLAGSDLLQIGMELVVSGAPAAPTVAPTVAPTQAPVEQPSGGATTPAPAGSQDVSSLCVSAYNDRSGDLMHQADTEELLPNAIFSLVGVDGPAGAYTTDGISEPYCFQNLKPGNYVLRQTPPAGYLTSGPGEWGVLLGAGQVYALQVGYTRDTGATGGNATPTTEVTVEPETSSNSLNKLLNTIVRVSGIIVLILALIVGGLFIVSRRR